jgi:hypothetical protein
VFSASNTLNNTLVIAGLSKNNKKYKRLSHLRRELEEKASEQSHTQIKIFW